MVVVDLHVFHELEVLGVDDLEQGFAGGGGEDEVAEEAREHGRRDRYLDGLGERVDGLAVGDRGDGVEDVAAVDRLGVGEGDDGDAVAEVAGDGGVEAGDAAGVADHGLAVLLRDDPPEAVLAADGGVLRGAEHLVEAGLREHEVGDAQGPVPAQEVGGGGDQTGGAAVDREVVAVGGDQDLVLAELVAGGEEGAVEVFAVVEAGVLAVGAAEHAGGGEDVVLEVTTEGLAGELLDEHAEQEVAGVAGVELAAGGELEGGVLEDRGDLLRGVAGAGLDAGGGEAVGVVGDAGGVGEEVADRDAGAGVVGEVGAQLVVEVELAGVAELEDGDGGELLGEAADLEAGVGVDRLGVAVVGAAVVADVQELAVFGDEHGAAELEGVAVAGAVAAHVARDLGAEVGRDGGSGGVGGGGGEGDGLAVLVVGVEVVAAGDGGVDAGPPGRGGGDGAGDRGGGDRRDGEARPAEGGGGRDVGGVERGQGGGAQARVGGGGSQDAVGEVGGRLGGGPGRERTLLEVAAGFIVHGTPPRASGAGPRGRG